MVWLWVWGIVTAVALVIEFITSDLITIWFGAGGLVTLLVVALAPELHVVWQLVIFVGVSVVLLLSTRKICLKLLKSDNIKTNVDALIGNKFVVKDVSEQGYTYQNINGTSWRVYPIENEKLETALKLKFVKLKAINYLPKK